MKKLALAIGLGAYVVFGTASGSLAAYRADNSSGAASIRDSSVIVWSGGTNARLVFVNEALYPDTAATEITSRARPNTPR